MFSTQRWIITIVRPSNKLNFCINFYVCRTSRAAHTWPYNTFYTTLFHWLLFIFLFAIFPISWLYCVIELSWRGQIISIYCFCNSALLRSYKKWPKENILFKLENNKILLKKVNEKFILKLYCKPPHITSYTIILWCIHQIIFIAYHTHTQNANRTIILFAN